MIPRSYSRDLALQLNFIQDALCDRENDSSETADADPDGRIPHLVLFGFADSRIETQVSFVSLI
jgi:hypothetical protein